MDMFFCKPAYAGSIHGNEQQIVYVINGQLDQDGVTYKVRQDYVNSDMSYLQQDDVDLTAEQAQSVISEIYSNVQTGVDSGYLERIGQTAPPETAPAESPKGGETGNNGSKKPDGQETDGNAEAGKQPGESTERDVDIQFVKEMVRKHSSEKLCLSELARQLNITVPALSQKFTRVVGMGYKEYLQNYRIGEACRLLANSNEKVADIATMVGYQDLKFFHLIFHRVIGLSPSDYRREQQKSQQSHQGAVGKKAKT